MAYRLLVSYGDVFRCIDARVKTKNVTAV